MVNRLCLKVILKNSGLCSIGWVSPSKIIQDTRTYVTN